MPKLETRAPALALVLMMTVVLSMPLPAQEDLWRLTGGASQVWFGGGATDTTGAGPRLGPSATVAWSLGAERRVGPVWIRLALSYLSAGLEVSGSGVAIVTDDIQMRQFEVAALAAIPVFRIGQGAEFTLAAGPAIDRWSVSGGESRTRFGALTSLQFSAPISPGWKLLASAGGSLAGSPFEASELPVEYETATLRTGRVGIGIQRAF